MKDQIFVYRPENYPGPVAIDCKPSKECDEYHKNFRIQINIESGGILNKNDGVKTASEQSENAIALDF